MITEQQIQEYIFSRDESEYENKRIYKTGGSYWSKLRPSQKRAQARKHLEFEVLASGKCPKCGHKEIIEMDGVEGETVYICNRCGHQQNNFSPEM